MHHFDAEARLPHFEKKKNLHMYLDIWVYL
jgi:hypothetical protein